LREHGPEQRDALDAAMDNRYINAGVTRLQRMLGPSCLVSLVLFAILVVLLRRWVHLPPVGLVALAIIVWMLVLGVMVRVRNRFPDGPDSEFE
jgi:hypothetical protein